MSENEPEWAIKYRFEYCHLEGSNGHALGTQEAPATYQMVLNSLVFTLEVLHFGGNIPFYGAD